MKTTVTSPGQDISFIRKTGELLLSWMIPGSGFMIHRDWARGAVIFVTLGITYFFGLLLHGTVVFPVLIPGEGFNLINILSFLAQMGLGSLSTLSLISSQTEAGILQGNQAYAFFDVASFYLIVAGSLNYLMLFNFYDRHLKQSVREPEPGSTEKSN